MTTLCQYKLCTKVTSPLPLSECSLDLSDDSILSLSASSLTSDIDNPYLTEWIHDLGLSMADREVLVSGKLLTANHIAAATRLMKKSFPSQNGLQDTHYLAEKGEWNSDVDGFVQIIYIDPGHWACLSNKFSDDVELFDSMLTTPIEGDNIIQQACCILQSEEPSLTVNVVGVQPQFGGADCGLFAISMAFDLCSDVDPFTQKVVQERMREHLVSCFEKSRMSSFPKVPRRAMDQRKRIVNSVSVGIYCVCRHVEEGQMVMCEVCHEWYHQHCISIPPEVFKRNSPPWECHKCKWKLARLC